MGVKSLQEKAEEILPDCSSVWDWLRQLPEYIQDYRKLSKTRNFRSHQKKCAQFLRNRFQHTNDDLSNDAVSAKVVFKYPSPDPLKDEFGFKKKWGFFPLIDPDLNQDEFPYADFLQAVAVCGENPQIGPVRLKSRSVYNLLANKELPQQLLFEVNPYISADLLARDLAEQIKMIQWFYKIKGKRIRYDGFRNTYITFVGFHLGWSQAKIRREIFGPDKGQPSYDHQTESRRQVVKRATKKFLERSQSRK